MTRIDLAAEVFDDFDRFFDHLSEPGTAADASQRISDIISALDILAAALSSVEGERRQA
jgi:hypothetical protein